ncbi:MAG TPA: MarR family transcriptional regulator [Caulobacterales bacterium]|nr:MarR family transcriptional regulator [Caulobacterales bacterium]
MSKKNTSRGGTPPDSQSDQRAVWNAALPDRGLGADALHRDLSTAMIAFHEAQARRIGMGGAEHKVFGALASLGVATPGQLAKLSGFTTGAITGIIDRLERAGYAKREPNPNDRRSLLVRPLQQEKVRAALFPAFQSLSQSMKELASRYTAEELGAIHRYLAETTDVLKRETEKLAEVERN